LGSPQFYSLDSEPNPPVESPELQPGMAERRLTVGEHSRNGKPGRSLGGSGRVDLRELAYRPLRVTIALRVSSMEARHSAKWARVSLL
jgi:hypothetical protein